MILLLLLLCKYSSAIEAGELSIWLANDFPDDKTTWNLNSKKSSAYHCTDISIADNDIIDITCSGINNGASFTYLFVRLRNVLYGVIYNTFNNKVYI